MTQAAKGLPKSILYAYNPTDKKFYPVEVDSDGKLKVDSTPVVSQLIQSVENALSASVYNLNAAPYSTTTSIANDYEIDSIVFYFTTTENKTITIKQGNFQLYTSTGTAQQIQLKKADIGQYFNADDNIDVDVTQTSGACLMDLKMKIVKGSNALAGNPAIEFLDESGTSYGIKQNGNIPYVHAFTHQELIAHGLITGHRENYALGYNSTVGTILTDITELGVAVTPLPTSAITMEVVSSSGDDISTGTGIRTLEIHGLNSSYDEIEETIIMNGITPVTTINQYIRINDFHSITVGSVGVAVGNIIIRASGGGTTYNKITADGNRSLQCHYTIPNNKVGYLTSWSGGSSGNKPIRLILRATAHGPERVLIPGVYHFQSILISNNGTIPFNNIIMKFPAKCDIKVSGSIIGAGTGEATAEFRIYYETQ